MNDSFRQAQPGKDETIVIDCYISLSGVKQVSHQLRQTTQSVTRRASVFSCNIKDDYLRQDGYSKDTWL